MAASMADHDASNNSWAKLPTDFLALCGNHLDAPGWAAARATCRDWGPITHGVKLLEIDVERDAHRWMMVLTCVARLFPRLSAVVLLCGNRITPAIFAERMAALAITSIKVEELELRFLYLTNPRLGAWLEDLSGIAGLRHLTVLRLAGGATPPPPFFEGLTALRRLRTLELLPGVYGQIAGFDMDVVQPGAAEDGQPAGNMGVCDAHLAAIGRLTQLNHISLRVCPHETTPAGLAALTSHGLLEQLEHLALYDAELPCSCLQEHLASASKLTGLQFGLSSVSRDLGAVTRLTSLKEISLDTAFLPSVQDLVLSAASGGLPASGPGAIRGLCLLDQTIGSPEQLACLSSFGSLSELVLVNPTAPAPGGGAANGDADDPEDLFHNFLGNILDEGQQQQQQQLEAPVAPIDLAVLSGLTSLRMLQVDVALRSYTGEGHVLRPLPLRLSAASVEALVPAWQKLETLDLSGLGGDLLPEDALTGLSRLSSLRYLSIMAPGGLPHDWAQGGGGQGGPPDFPDFLGDVLGPQPVPAAAAAGGGGGSGGNGNGSAARRSWPWWHVPKGLASLCLSHMDLTGRGASQCTISSSSAAEPGIDSSSSGKAGGSGGGRAKRRSSSAGGPCEGEGEEEEAVIPCCLLPAASRHEHRHGLSLPGLSLFHNTRASPLRPLSKRRRQTKQRTEHSDAAADADRAAAASGGSSSSQGAAAAAAGCDGGADAAVGSSQVAGEECFELSLCTCAPRLPAHFSCLQSLLLEHVTLPHSFLPRVLPPLASSLESLALLHVSGTRPADMASLSSLTTLTSLRVIPSDHDVGGLEPLLGMRHLKKLNMRLTHLQPSDVALLGRLRSLFCLSLAAPCMNAALLPGFPSAVRLQQVEDVVAASLPYCDVELQPEPDMTAVQ